MIRLIVTGLFLLAGTMVQSQAGAEIPAADTALGGRPVKEAEPEGVRKTYTTAPLLSDQPVSIDGVLNEAAWDRVGWGGGFIEQRPDENTPPDHQTQFKILYDAKNLYVGIRCFDSEPEHIVKRLSRRDGFDGDWVGIFIDSYHDRRTAFGFVATAAGVKGDIFESNNGGNEDDSWNPIWFLKTSMDELGWTAEMRIPLSQLKFGNGQNQVWGLQVMRRLFREEERSVWQRLPVDAPGFISEFGELDGLRDLEPQGQLEIQPYTVAKEKTYEPEAGNPFRDGNDMELTGGLDAKIGVTNDLTLDLTLNPDFGQVEADPSAIALDGYQIFFQEQRPFFVENKNIFNYPVSPSESGNTFNSDNVFYSRRIGRRPQGYPATAEGEYVDQPATTPILGAAKFSGKTQGGWSVGLLESVTARRSAEIDLAGDRRKEVVEPLTNYLVGRLQKDFHNGDTYIGTIVTATNRESLPESLAWLHQAAYTGGFDFKHQWKNRDWFVGGSLVWSHVSGSEQAIEATQRAIAHLFQREGADYLDVDPSRTSLTGTGGNLQFGKQGDGHWRFETGATWRSPELELNDIGFQRQADDFRHYAWVGYQTLKPDKTFRQIGVNYNHWSAWDFGGNHNLLMFNTNSWQNWAGNWFTNLGLTVRPIQYSNSALRGGPRLRVSPTVSFWNGVNTDNRKKLRFSIFQNGTSALDGSRDSYFLEGGLTYQPVNALRISANPNLEINNDKLQYIDNLVANGEARYLNGTIKQHTLGLSLRLNYTINPNLTIQYWGQPFISRGNYSEFKHVSDPLASRFSERITPYGPGQISFSDGMYTVDEQQDGTPDFSFGNPDFSFIQFRSNLVLRWEYVPGSELYLVWSQDLTTSGDPADNLLGSLESNIFGKQQPTNIFLLKATYRFAL